MRSPYTTLPRTRRARCQNPTCLCWFGWLLYFREFEMLWFELHVYQFCVASPYTSTSLVGSVWSRWPLTLWPHRIIFSFGIFYLTWDNLPHLSGHQTTMPASSWCCQKIKSPEAREGSSYSMRQSAWQGGAGEDVMAKDASDPFLLLFSNTR